MSVNITKLVNLGRTSSGLTHVGYSLDGAARVELGVVEIPASSGIYKAVVAVPEGQAGYIIWDDGPSATAYAPDEYNTLAIRKPLWSGGVSQGSQTDCTLVSGPGYDITGGTVVVCDNTGAGQSVTVRSYNTSTGYTVFSAPLLRPLSTDSKVRLYHDPADPGESLYVGYASGGDSSHVYLGAGFPASLPVPNVWVSIEGGPSAGTIYRMLTYSNGVGSIDGSYATSPTNKSFLRVYGMSPSLANLTAAGLDGVTVESGMNARQALSLDAAVLAGLISGAGTLTSASTYEITIKGAGTNTTRVVAQTDQNGNRTAITLSLPA